jgi:hypothetical protein
MFRQDRNQQHHIMYGAAAIVKSGTEFSNDAKLACDSDW